MNILRNSTYFILVVTLITVLTACGTDENSKSSSSNEDIKCSDVKTSLTMGGSSAQQAAMTTWIKNYQGKCKGNNLIYNAVGSGAGVTQFSDKQIALAGSDFALSSEQQSQANKACSNGQAFTIPMVSAPIDIIYNVQGVNNLHLNGDLMAKIFNGTITKWNDNAIQEQNKDQVLPNLSIQVGHRADGSGTTYNFTNFLHSVSPNIWNNQANKDWPKEGAFSSQQGLQHSDGVSNFVNTTAGSIGYVEASYAKNQKYSIAHVAVTNKYTDASENTIAKFINQSNVTYNANGIVLNFKYTDASDIYPLVLVTYEIVCSKNIRNTSSVLKSFLEYTSSDSGQKDIVTLSYVPLPDAVLLKVRDKIKSIT